MSVFDLSTAKMWKCILCRSSNPVDTVSPKSQVGDIKNWSYYNIMHELKYSKNMNSLQACQHELHRRHTAYHQWKKANPMGGTRSNEMMWNPNEPGEGYDIDLSMLEPTDLMKMFKTSNDVKLLQACEKEILARLGSEFNMNNEEMENVDDTDVSSIDSNDFKIEDDQNQDQRFFKIPFIKQEKSTHDDGFWYAHFKGQHIIRQMELFSERPPILLRSGRDDPSAMCQLTLDETGLTAKMGAEILAEEFDIFWLDNGGAQYS